MKTRFLALTSGLLVSAVAVGPVASAAVTATRSGDSITVQNDVLKFSIDLKAGARIDTFVYKPFVENIVYPVASSGGLLMDHVWEQTWPGEFLYRKYDGEIVKAGPDEAVVRVWTVGTQTTTKGVRFERLLSLKDGERALRCRVTLTNNAEQGRVTGYWSQNNFWFGGKENMTWFRPGVRGIDQAGVTAAGADWFTNAWYYIDDATVGWNGAANRERGMGIMCLMNYNDLWRIYDNLSAVTTEWMYDKVAIPAGKAWTTDIVLVPVAGVTGFRHGSPDLIANFEVAPAPGGLRIEHQLTRSLVALKDVTVQTEVQGLKSQWKVTLPPAKFAELNDTLQKQAVQAGGMGAMPAGIFVTVTGTGADGQPVTVKYGDYYGGAEGKNNDPFSMKPYLAFARTPKAKVFLKPDVMKYTPNAEPRVLVLRGLWYQFFGIDAAVQAAFPKATIKEGWLDASPVGYALSYFPADYPDLLSYDLIVLANLPAAPLDLVGQEMLKDYVKAGGNLLLCGGDQAFGQAGFANAELLALLPVELGGVYNWRKLKGENAMKAAGAAHPVTAGVALGAGDKVFYSHLCTPKAGALVPVTAGDRPILVLGQAGQGGGRIGCLLATPFGEAGSGETAFWESAGYRKLMQNLMGWLVRGP